MGIQCNYSLFASSWCLPIPPVALHVRKRWKRNIRVNCGRNGARSPYVSFLETRNAQGGTSLVSWKRNTRKIWVCFLCFLFSVFRLRPYKGIPKRAANGPQNAICLGGWVVFDWPSKKKRPFFFSPPEGVRYLYNTDRNWAVIKDRKKPSAIQLFSISLASFVRMLVTASTCFVEICCCARVWTQTSARGIISYTISLLALKS